MNVCAIENINNSVNLLQVILSLNRANILIQYRLYSQCHC